MMQIVEEPPPPENTGSGKRNPFIVRTKDIDWEETCYKKLGTTQAADRKKFADWIDANRSKLVSPNTGLREYIPESQRPEYEI